jgi:hypothetical protein
MYVPHEMETKFQRYDPLFWTCGRVRKLFSKLVDLIDDTIFSRPYRGRRPRRRLWVSEACLIDIWSSQVDIDKMPAPGPLVADLRAEPIGVPVFIGPGCRTCDVMRRQAARSALTVERAAGLRNRSAIRAIIICPSFPHAKQEREGVPLPIDTSSSIAVTVNVRFAMVSCLLALLGSVCAYSTRQKEREM